VRVGIIGCGKIGLGSHLPHYRSLPGVEVVAVADPTPERLALAQRESGLAPADCYSDYRALLDRADVEAVSVTVRAPVVIAACEAGKSVLSEKPLATIPAEADAMIAAARRAGVCLALMHNYLFRPEIVAMRRLIDAGAIGRVELAILNLLGVEDRPGSPEYRPWWRHDPAAAGGGVLMDMLHCVYLAAHLVGSEIRAVSAAVDRRGDPDARVEDTAYCRFEHATGFSLVNVAWGQGPGGIEIMGTGGRILQFNEGFATTPFRSHERLYVVNDDGIESVPVPADRRSSAIFADFVSAVRTGQPPIASGEAGQRTLQAVLAAYASAALETTVRLPLPTDHPVYQQGVLGVAALAGPADSRVRTRGLYRRSES
jgi:predicted dehydrogenase